MPLPKQRPGDPASFHVYPSASDEGTLGDPETVIWSSIRHLCSRGVAETIAQKAHGIARRRDIRAIGQNLNLYVRQAYEFYEVARIARPNTAPLIYYYSFLNLAKACCEIRHPNFHRHHECYRHGVSWRPSPTHTVDVSKEVVSLTTRGVWHVLWESLSGQRCTTGNPTRLRLRELLAHCLEISTEVEVAFGVPSPFLYLIDPGFVYDRGAREAWLRFSIYRVALKSARLTAPRLLNQLSTQRSGYTEVQALSPQLRTFESSIPATLAMGQTAAQALHDDVAGMNIYSHLEAGTGQVYCVQVGRGFPLRMPQSMILYTVLFWLGSLVRYDPHSVNYLMDSKYWSLIDGFMSQSRLWLLEQLEWFLYQNERTLRLVR